MSFEICIHDDAGGITRSMLISGFGSEQLLDSSVKGREGITITATRTRLACAAFRCSFPPAKFYLTSLKTESEDH